MKKIRLTRKVQLQILGSAQERQENYTKLFEWNSLTYRAANQVVSHLFFQSKQSEFSYLSASARLALLDDSDQNINGVSVQVPELRNEEVVPMLNTSKQNSTYRLLSEKYKGRLPSDIFNNINNTVTRSFHSESTFYYNGERSLRSYKKGLPIPFSIRSIKNLHRPEDRSEYMFTLFGINFETYFGRDRSKNRELFDLATEGSVKICSSSIKIIGKKIFFFAVFETTAERIDGNNQMTIELGDDFVIKAKIGNDTYGIGTKDQFIYQKKVIKMYLDRVKNKVKFNRGGRGKKHKLITIEHARQKSNNFWNTRMHSYSKEVIDFCIKNQCSRIVFAQPDGTSRMGISGEPSEKSAQNLLPNWSYYGLREKIVYKGTKVGVKIVA